MYQTKGKFFSMFGKIYRHQLDAKNRMRIPAKLREESVCFFRAGAGRDPRKAEERFSV